MNDDRPQHERLSAVVDESRAIGEFLDWVTETHGAYLAVMQKGYGSGHEEWLPLRISTEQLLAEFFGVDLIALEQEKRAMLQSLSPEKHEEKE